MRAHLFSKKKIIIFEGLRLGSPPMQLQQVKIEFSGGCELLFGGNSTLVLSNVVPVGTTINQLVVFLKQNHLKGNPSLFVDVSGAALRPGILALVNDTDCEVMGGVDQYAVQDGDTVAFISTLHGG